MAAATDIPTPTREADFTFASREPFQLERGGQLSPVTVHYAIYGELNAARDHAVLVCHALSGSARVADWWLEMFGTGRPFDVERCCVLGVNILGSCYGSCGPLSVNPATGKPFGPDFPLVSVRDIVRTQVALLDHLGIQKLAAVTGGSIGGMQALQWAIDYPERVGSIVTCGSSPLSAMGLALNHAQRLAIQNDPAWNGGHYSPDNPPTRGIGLARAIAMCTYKSAELFDQRYGRKPNRNGEDPVHDPVGRFDVAGYLDHQQDVFIKRFDANSYISITKTMDAWDLPADGGFERLRRAGVPVLNVGITSDWLFPAAHVRQMHETLRAAGVNSHYAELESAHGHDAFLADADKLAPIMSEFIWSQHSVLRNADAQTETISL